MLKHTLYSPRALGVMLVVLLPIIAADIASALDINEALLNAARDGDVGKVERLLDGGADINSRDIKGWTPLMFAVGSSHSKLAKLLLEKGAAVNLKTKEGLTPLMKAALHNDSEILTLLLAKGADVHVRNLEGNTALGLARDKGHKEAIELLTDTAPRNRPRQ
ncbi:MAG: ankyrin repeat domain-containing protein [Desulfomonile tiedjei]|nr:ankyrin repeat domain-containing protein [Desulfomonile tiedjei]